MEEAKKEQAEDAELEKELQEEAAYNDLLVSQMYSLARLQGLSIQEPSFSNIRQPCACFPN